MTATSDRPNYPAGFPAGTIIKAKDAPAALEIIERRKELELDISKFRQKCDQLAVDAQKLGFEHGLARTLADLADYNSVINKRHKTHLDALLPMFADVVGDILMELLGNRDEKDVIEAVVKRHLGRFSMGQSVELFAAPETAQTVRSVLSKLDQPNASDIEVHVDDKIKPGRILLRTEDGYFDLGIAEQAEVAKRFVAKTLTRPLFET